MPDEKEKEKKSSKSKKDKSKKDKEKEKSSKKSSSKKSSKKEKEEEKQQQPKEEKKVDDDDTNTKKKKKKDVTAGNKKDDAIQFNKLSSTKGRELAVEDAAFEEDDDDPEEDDGLVPIPKPNNPPMETIRLILKQPDLKQLRMVNVDPANTTIRMVRDFLEQKYYQGHKLPRREQRQLLYRFKPIFNETGDPNIDDAKTLADHGITQDESIIELSKMHVYVISPSTKKSMLINNVDPMNDVIFEMRKLALEDGYPIDKLRVLHKEANNKEIKRNQNSITFFHCGVKHQHTLILEWPKIVIKVKLPILDEEDAEKLEQKDGVELYDDRSSGRKFKLVDLTVQAELDPVQVIHDFVTEQTGIPQDVQTLLYNPAGGGKKTAKRNPKLKELSKPDKIIADYKIQEFDIVELKPMSVTVNLINGPDGPKKTCLQNVFPNDTVGSIKAAIESGKGESDGIPSIPKTNQSLTKTTDGKELHRDSQALFKAFIQDGDDLDVEKTKITVKVKLPESTTGKGGNIIEIGVNPKLDDVETVRNLIADKIGIPEDMIPPLVYDGERMNPDGSKKNNKKKVANFGIVENDVIDVEPIKVNINLPKDGGTICIDNVDPFNDTIDDIKDRLGPEDLNILPVEKQRLRMDGKNLDDNDDDDDESEDDDDSRSSTSSDDSSDKDSDDSRSDSDNDKDSDDKKDDKKKKKKKDTKKAKAGGGPSNKKGTPSSPLSSRPLIECKIMDDTTLDLEKSKIDVDIKQPNGEILTVEDVDPRKDTIDTIKDFLSEKYYEGKDKDGTIPEDQLLPLSFDGTPLDDDDDTKTLREYGITDDEDDPIKMKGIKVYLEFGPKDPDTGKRTIKTLQNIDPMHHVIHQGKNLAATEDSPADQLIMLHKEGDMKELENVPEMQTFYDCGIKEGNTLVINRKPITVTVKIPTGDDGDNIPDLIIKVDPDEDDLDTIRQAILDKTGVPMDLQKLNKIVNDDDDDEPSKERLEAPGETKISAPEVNIVADCTLELEPMMINVKTPDGEVVPVEVSPSSTVEDVKKKLADKKGLEIPASKQRLLNDDGEELGGDENNDNSLGSDKSTLAALGVKDGDTFDVEKSKISLTVKMPHGMDDLEVVVDPKNDGVDEIRQQVFDATGIPKEYQQRFKFSNDELLDKGYKKDSEQDDADSGRKRTLAPFDFKEFDTITLDATRVYIKRIPEEEQFVLEEVNPLTDRLHDLKLRVTEKTLLAPFKQRFLNPETDEEYIGNKDSTEKIHEYGIQDGDVINMELAKINFIIVLPCQEKLEMTIDPRKDDLQKVRDLVFKRYYKSRKLPKEAMREMRYGSRKVWDDEPGTKKMIELGVIKDDDLVKLKPCPITIETPTKVIFCPNADPFFDNLKCITEFVKHEGINVDGCHILFKKKKMKDLKSVLYDLKIGDDDTLEFVK